MRPVIYVLACADGSLYTGWTTDLQARYAAHRRGTGAKYTRSRLPCVLAAWWSAKDRSAAQRDEALFKRLTRAQKLARLAEGRRFRRTLRCAPLLLPTVKGQRLSSTTHQPPSAEEQPTLTKDAHTNNARISTAKGDIVFSFYPDDAPVHCGAFIKLARAGFYDGTTFHRVEPGFVIQGGCPEGTGTGGPGYRLKAEFSARPHVRGTVAMARSSNRDSAGSQFYICLGDARFLDSEYTVFGQTVEGIEVVDQIRPGDAMEHVTIEPK